MGHQIAKYASNFKKSGQFEFVVEFYAILGDFGRFSQKNEKSVMFFLQNPPKIAQNCWFCLRSWRIRKGKNLRILKMVKILNFEVYLAIWQLFEKWTIFLMLFIA